MSNSDPLAFVGTNSPSIVIPIKAYKGVQITFLVLALAAAIYRTFIRVSRGQQRVLDDYVLLPFASATLLVSTVLAVVGATTLYKFTGVQSLAKKYPLLAATAPTGIIVEEIDRVQRLGYAFGCLIWTSVFAVKFCYLYFFRLLIDRQRGLMMFWRVAVLVTLIAAILNVFAPFIMCPKFGIETIQCAEPYYIRRRLATTIVTIVLDIVTDLMILAIPPYLMSKTTLRPRQKVGIASFLSLSIVMIIIAIVRIARIKAADFEIWGIFLQQFEACIAVLMLSLTAFRTVFVTKKSAGHADAHRRHRAHGVRRGGSGSSSSSRNNSYSGSSARSLLRGGSLTLVFDFIRSTVLRQTKRSPASSATTSQAAREPRWADVEKHIDVTVPSATLTGVRTVIDGSSPQQQRQLAGGVPLTASQLRYHQLNQLGSISSSSSDTHSVDDRDVSGGRSGGSVGEAKEAEGHDFV